MASASPTRSTRRRWRRRSPALPVDQALPAHARQGLYTSTQLDRYMGKEGRKAFLAHHGVTGAAAG